jgi:hypothetical protein
MAQDYRKFKTPYFEIEVGDPSWKRRVKLPHHILRLVEKIEITESMWTPEHTPYPQMVIVFSEGSREPASPDYKMGTSGLYQVPVEGGKVDMDIAGSLTNRPGIITDLRFSGASGVTFLTEKEKKTGKVDNSLQKNVVGKDTTRKFKSEPSAPRFVFQEFNKVKVTWGYLEDPETVRSYMLNILQVATSFPESGMPKTTITCLPTDAVLDQFATKNGIKFGTRKTLSQDGDSLLVFEDLKTDAVIRDVCKKAGMPCIVSTNIPGDIIDKDKQKMWIAGESFHQFMTRMAEMSGCVYRVVPNPQTGIDTLVFIKKADFERRVVLKDKELLHWKGPGSILKSINISADFGGLLAHANKGLDEKGEPQSEDTLVDERLFNTYKSSETNKKPELINADPTGNNPNPAAVAIKENIANGEVSGVVENSPKESKESMSGVSAARSDAQARLISIDFTTIGYTRLTPGVMEIAGIGVRYSGKYRILSVTHTIDPNGYVTKCNGVSQSLSAGGTTIPPIFPEGQDKDSLVDAKLFEKQAASDPLAQYRKFQGIA